MSNPATYYDQKRFIQPRPKAALRKRQQSAKCRRSPLAPYTPKGGHSTRNQTLFLPNESAHLLANLYRGKNDSESSIPSGVSP